MRLGLGGGFASTSASSSRGKLSGGSLFIDMALGGSVTPNLVVYGEIVGHSILSPTYEMNGVSTTWDSTTVDLYGLGPGVAYYFMPLNLYLAGALLMQWVVLGDSNNSDVSTRLTNLGVGFNLMVGKEWWVSSDWGLGVAGAFLFGSAKDRYQDTRWNSSGFAVFLSATYN